MSLVNVGLSGLYHADDWLQHPTLWTLLSVWSWQPLVLVGVGLAAAGYAYAFYHFHRHGWLNRLTRRGQIRRSQPWCFTAGLATILLALLSPIDPLADLLFLMHMVQHVLLIMVAPLLILLGLPVPLVRWLILKMKLRKILTGLTHPLTAYLLYNGNLLLWHIPFLYEAALRNQFVHDLEHALFFYTALFFWWRLRDPTHGWFPFWSWPPAKWLYLMVAAPPSYVLGAILWANPRVFYPYYTQVPRPWDLTVLWDQRYGGMLMWAQGWMFVMASMIVFFLWYDPSVASGELEGEEG
jgi:cytochrome c oxidase assembly factor CtaG